MPCAISWVGFSCLVIFLALSCSAPTAVSPQALALENQCVQSLQSGDYEGAATRCELCLEYDEYVAECVNGLGLVAFAKGDNDTAIQKFSEAIQISANFGQARNNLGAVYFKAGNYNEALPLFNAAIQIDPGYQDARYNAALSYLRLGQRAAASNDPKGTKANYALAQDQYLKLLALNPDYANAYRDLGLMRMYAAKLETEENLSGELEKANTYFKQCLQVDPHNEICRESYGLVLLSEKQYDDALYQFVQCLAENKNNASCIKGLDGAYQGSQLKGQALGSYMHRLKANPNDPEGHYGYCVALFNKSLSEQAVSECKTALQLDAKLCNAYYQLAMHYKKVLNSTETLNNCRSYLLCDLNLSDQTQAKSCQRVVTALSGL